MIDMFEEIWNRLIVPSMKTVVETSDDPYKEFGIPAAVAVPAPEEVERGYRAREGHAEGVGKDPIEIQAEHARKSLDKQYLDKWAPYGIKSVDKTTRESLDEWQQSYIKALKGRGSVPGIWPPGQPPEPKAVTRMKKRALKERERMKRKALKERGGAAAASDSESFSDTTSSDDDDDGGGEEDETKSTDASAGKRAGGNATSQSGGRKKRSVTKKQLAALAKGRAIRMRNIRKNKRGGY